MLSWVAWLSKHVRDTGVIIDDPRVTSRLSPMSFDGKRLIYGGFNIILDE
ncbi:hypothetical protein QT397_14005 [Microbulbifer sp. MKSA007]|nr:hypothetical protein QT397_14005 [Microbulbifer sp. MKSA007]